MTLATVGIFDPIAEEQSPRRSRLDRQLIWGVAPQAETQLARHASRLVSRTERDRLCATVRGLLDSALASRPMLAAVRPHRRRIAEAQAPLRLLIALLDSTTPVSAKGVARLRMLLSDDSGPLYQNGRGDLPAELNRILTDL